MTISTKILKLQKKAEKAEALYLRMNKLKLELKNDIDDLDDEFPGFGEKLFKKDPSAWSKIRRGYGYEVSTTRMLKALNRAKDNLLDWVVDSI